jgi:hypothetical protein
MSYQVFMRLILGRRAVIIGLAASGHFPNCPALEEGSDAWLGFAGPSALVSMPLGCKWGSAAPSDRRHGAGPYLQRMKKEEPSDDA